MTTGRRRLAAFAIPATIFSAVALLTLRYFFQYKKSLVWSRDAVAQHFPALYFFNDWIRGFLHHPFGGLPLWTSHIGLGSDIISTLAFYVVGDPFALISLAFPMSRMEYAYAFIFVVRLACAGVFSNLYFRRMGAKPLPALTATILYVFATFLLYAALPLMVLALGVVVLTEGWLLLSGFLVFVNLINMM